MYPNFFFKGKKGVINVPFMSHIRKKKGGISKMTQSLSWLSRLERKGGTDQWNKVVVVTIVF